MIDEQFLVRCHPGQVEGQVSYQSRRGGNGGGRDSIVRDVTVTSKFGSSRTKKQRITFHEQQQQQQQQQQEELFEPMRSLVREEETIVSNLVDSNLDVVAEAPQWVEKTKQIKVHWFYFSKNRLLKTFF